MTLSVTLKQLRENRACIPGYNKVVRALQGLEYSDRDAQRTAYIPYNYAEQIPLPRILESNGIDDALWALRCIDGYERDARMFAVWCARQVTTKTVRLDALEVAEAYALGQRTHDSLAWARGELLGYIVNEECSAPLYALDSNVDYAVAEAARSARCWQNAEYDRRLKAQCDMFISMCEGTAPWQTSMSIGIVEALERVLVWAESGVGLYRPNVGICANVGLGYGRQLAEAYDTWPEYSGVRDYPVPSPDETLHCGGYYHNTLNKWVGAYGAARIRLLKHCIEYFKEKQQ